MSSAINRTPYLRTTRDFKNKDELSETLDKAYIDIAQAVNNRTIGIFPVNLPAITGESWVISMNQKQQTLRQVYPFGVIATGVSITIAIAKLSTNQFSRIYGTCITNVPDHRPIPFAAQNATSNITVSVNLITGNITVQNGSTAPQISSGIIVLEWLSAV